MKPTFCSHEYRGNDAFEASGIPKRITLVQSVVFIVNVIHFRITYVSRL